MPLCCPPCKFRSLLARMQSLYLAHTAENPTARSRCFAKVGLFAVRGARSQRICESDTRVVKASGGFRGSVVVEPRRVCGAQGRGRGSEFLRGRRTCLDKPIAGRGEGRAIQSHDTIDPRWIQDFYSLRKGYPTHV